MVVFTDAKNRRVRSFIYYSAGAERFLERYRKQAVK